MSTGPRVVSNLCGKAFFLIAISSCGGAPDAWEVAPLAQKHGYVLLVRTYDDGDYLDKPFKIGVRMPSGKDAARTVLHAEQCKNVKVIPAAGHVLIFYERLMLKSYSNYVPSDAWPGSVLCDLSHTACQELLSASLQAGEKVYDVCSAK